MTAIVKNINLPCTLLPPTKEYRYIPPLPARLVNNEMRNWKQLQESRVRGGSARRKLSKLTTEKIERGIKLREIGLTWDKTGEALGVTGDAVRMAIKRYHAEHY